MRCHRFYRRASWRGAFWAALFIAAIRQTKMNVQKEAKARLWRIAPGVVRFVDAKIGEILSVDVVNDNIRRQSQPHKRWVEALLKSALSYRDIGAAIVVVDPNGTRPYGLGIVLTASPRTSSSAILRQMRTANGWSISSLGLWMKKSECFPAARMFSA